MDQSFVGEMKEKLLASKTKIEEDLHSVADPDVPGEAKGDFSAKYPDYGNHEDENAGEVETYHSNLSTKESLEKYLDQVDEALSRIDDGTYGHCIKCGKEIPEARLQAFPAAQKCITCSE